MIGEWLVKRGRAGQDHETGEWRQDRHAGNHDRPRRVQRAVRRGRRPDDEPGHEQADLQRDRDPWTAERTRQRVAQRTVEVERAGWAVRDGWSVRTGRRGRGGLRGDRVRHRSHVLIITRRKPEPVAQVGPLLRHASRPPPDRHRHVEHTQAGTRGTEQELRVVELVLREADLDEAARPDRPVAVGDVRDVRAAEEVDEARVDGDARIARRRLLLVLPHPTRPDDEVRQVRDDRGHERRHLARVVLAVRVERDHDVHAEALGDQVPGLERGALARVHGVGDDLGPGRTRDRRRAVAGPVVDHQDVGREPGDHGRDLREHAREGSRPRRRPGCRRGRHPTGHPRGPPRAGRRTSARTSRLRRWLARSARPSA